ncbi:uncharacterized protein PAC_06046 [Phialocephala subalpina]|uniref:Uncharacterized protein n=1 Tax=Phialocephala subalpina TaxID=576137 RepID=A0A1L7WTR8_9HELO|nr:uncharacterized protein PAC_06046 [Phialocephala subalpina]
MSHFTISIKSLDHTRTIACKRLGPAFFDIPGSEGETLRTTIEDDITTLLPRNVQLMEAVNRLCERRRYRYGLCKGMEICGRQSLKRDELRSWLEEKREGHEFFNNHGWKVLDEEPLPALALKYTVGDTMYLFGLHDVFKAKMNFVARTLEMSGAHELMKIVDEETIREVRDAKTEEFRPVGSTRQDYHKPSKIFAQYFRGGWSLAYSQDRSGQRRELSW